MISLFSFHSSLFQPPRLVGELHTHFAPLFSRWERPGEGACISAKLECSAIHHSYFTLHSSTGGLGYGG